jgi:hypothetical protein
MLPASRPTECLISVLLCCRSRVKDLLLNEQPKQRVNWNRMSVTIFFENLAVCGCEERLPLSSLDLDENSHLHGGLRFQIEGRLVPHMGYFGPDDVCFNTWVVEFERLIKTFDTVKEATYVFDEGEQGQPAYQFEKCGEKVSLSIIEGVGAPDWKADPEWLQIEFDYQEFKTEYLKFKAMFLEEVKSAAPEAGRKWAKRLLSRRL